MVQRREGTPANSLIVCTLQYAMRVSFLDNDVVQMYLTGLFQSI